MWLLLSQHLVSKDRSLDDIALHVYEEHEQGGAAVEARPLNSVSVYGNVYTVYELIMQNPYSNAQHVLVCPSTF